MCSSDLFGQAFADAWFKLIHRDLGPKSRYLGKDYVQKDFLFQDPISAVDYTLVDAADIKSLKKEIMASSLSVSDRIKTAWASAVSFRGSDDRGGANGARICLEPQKSWEANEPQLLARNIAMLRNIQKKFNQAQTQGPKPKKISMADLIVLAGNTGVEEAALKAGSRIEVPFLPGRNDASQEQTEVKSFDFLKVTADGFRNYYNKDQSYLNPSLAFADKADLLNLTPQEMTVLTGGMRVLGANYKDSKNGVFTKTPGTLTNDFFVNLLEKSTVWTESADRPGVYIGRDRSSNAQKWTATSQDLIFGTNASLRLISYSYGTVNAKRKFVTDFAGAWNKVMNLDQFEVNR